MTDNSKLPIFKITSPKDSFISNNKVDPWHTNISPDGARIFGHYNNKTHEFIEMALNKLPEIQMETGIKVGFTGYWDCIDEIKSSRYGKTTDTEGRLMFFIDNHVIMQRYNGADTLIFYDRDSERRCHSVAYDENVQLWKSKLQNL